MTPNATPPPVPQSAYAFTAEQRILLSTFHSLRRSLLALDVYAGCDFAKVAALAWRDRRWAGLAAACWAVSHELVRNPETRPLVRQLRALAASLAVEAHTSPPLAGVSQ